MFLLTNETDKFVVVQSNELVEASYSPELTTRAHKVARFILSLISPDDNDLKLYTVPISTLKTFLGFKENATWGNFYSEIRDIAEKLNQEPIVIKSGEKVTTAYFVAGYEIDAGARTVTFEVSLLLKPYLLALKRNFTRYPLNYIARLRSAYSIRLYELLCQYRNIGHRTFDLATLQMLLGSNYEFYGNFKDKVLTIAKRDLVSNTDIDFDYVEIKTARKVTALKFTIFANSPIVADDEILEVLPLPIQAEAVPLFSAETLQKLTQWGLKTDALKKYTSKGFSIILDEKLREQAILRCNNALEAYYLEKLAFCQQTNKGTPRNQVGFFIKALQEDWREGTAGKTTVTSAATKPKADNKPAQIKQLEARIKEVKSQWQAAKQPIYEKIMSDTEGFALLYEAVREKAGTLKSTIFPTNLSPTTIFNNNGMASNLLKVKMEEQHTAEFEPINDTFRSNIQQLETALTALMTLK